MSREEIETCREVELKMVLARDEEEFLVQTGLMLILSLKTDSPNGSTLLTL
jgi:hypothetical protein